MSPRRILIVLISLMFLASSLPVAAQKSQVRKEEFRKDDPKDKAKSRQSEDKALKKWIDEDVTYIITGEERSAWKNLKTDEEREAFIESFWLRRDPTPDTVDNEFRDDHYERIAYANEHFASGIPGWKTDRGRIYVMYGKPDEIESHPSGGTYDRPIEEGGGTTSTFPFEIWRYRYIEGIGNEVLLEFVDPSMSGEYRMTIDPSEKDALLHVPGAGLTWYEQIYGIDKAERLNRDGASIGNPLGNTSRTNPFDKLQLMADIFRPPAIKYKDLEAVITTRLSYNVLPFNFRTDFVRVTEDTVLTPVTISLQNKDLAWQDQDSVHKFTGHILIIVTSVNGRRAPGGTIEDNIELQIPDSLFKQQLEGISLYQRIIPLRPGRYKIDIVVKDVNSGNTGVINKALPVPRFPDERLQLSSLILAERVETLPPNQVGSGSFILAGNKVRPSVTGEFVRGRDKEINVWFQAYNLKLDEATKKPSATIEVSITKNGQAVKKIVEQSSELANAAAQMTFVKAIPVTEFEPGQYSVLVKVTDNLTKDVNTQSDTFTVR
jgi:GWxTD domain-containing protein